MPMLDRDGVKIHYEVTGEGPALLLTHGYSATGEMWQGQLATLSPHFKVITWDMRGHGASDKPQQRYTMAGFADDLAWLCSKLELVKPIVIGHSMGGIVSFELAGRHPGVPSAIVLVDSSVAMPPASRESFANMLALLGGSDYQTAMRDFVTKSLFIASDDAVRRAQIVAEMSSTAQHVMLSAMEAVRGYEPTEAAAGLTVPCLYIAANMVPLRSDPARLRELVPGLHYGMTVGAGHFCQLEVPDQVNAMIDRFLVVSGVAE